MEIRCTQCEHLGPAAAVLPSEHGVVLVCANCGHHNPLDVSEAPAGSPSDEAPEPIAPITPIAPIASVGSPAKADTSQESPWLVKGALERLIPESGEGRRCRKCAQLLADAEENCPRCGLSVVESQRFEPGTAPWERPPEGQEAAFEQASLLWKSVDEHPTDDNITKFVMFAREEDLLELGIRQLRFFLIEHPGHERATTHLEELATSFQSKMIVAQAQAEVRAGNIVATTVRMKGILLWIVFAMWAAILALFISKVGAAGGF